MKQAKQRGSGWSIKLVFTLYKLFGYKFIYYLMYPVTFFYFIFSPNLRKIMKNYYNQLGLDYNSFIYFEHLRMFANCMVDRFISRQEPKSYSFEPNEIINHIDTLNNGCMMILSHYGGWATMQNNATFDNTVNVIMQEVLMESIKKIENSIEEKIKNVNVIDLSSGMIAVSVSIANAISKGEVIAMMGDRAVNKKHSLYVDFFGKKAAFNKNPFYIAYKNHLPIINVLVIHIGMQKYKVKALKIEMDYDLEEKEALQKSLKEYVEFYEDILKKYPNQWFNFYEFWEEEK